MDETAAPHSLCADSKMRLPACTPGGSRLSKRGYTDAELDALVEELSGGNVWNEGFLYYAAGGQFCDLEGDRSRPMHSGELWWNLIGAITKLQILGEYNRLEECAPLMKNAGLSCSAGRNG